MVQLLIGVQRHHVHVPTAVWEADVRPGRRGVHASSPAEVLVIANQVTWAGVDRYVTCEGCHDCVETLWRRGQDWLCKPCLDKNAVRALPTSAGWIP